MGEKFFLDWGSTTHKLAIILEINHYFREKGMIVGGALREAIPPGNKINTFEFSWELPLPNVSVLQFKVLCFLLQRI